MAAQAGREEETRCIFLRASSLYVPIGRPAIRHRFALWEEAHDHADVARAVLEAVRLQCARTC